MSSGHNRHKGFSQTSKRYDGALKEEHQRGRSKQHSTETAKSTLDDKAPKDDSSVGRKVTQAT